MSDRRVLPGPSLSVMRGKAPSLSALSLSGSSFSLQYDNCSNHGIKQPGSCIFEAVFKPTSGCSTMTANVSIPSNDPDFRVFNVRLTGYANCQPAAGPVTPSVVIAEPAIPQEFSASYIDGNGYSDLKTTDFLVTSDSTENAIWLTYDTGAHTFSLHDDAGSGISGSCAPGAGETIENSQGRLDCGGSSVSASWSALTVNLRITPKAAFAGPTAKVLKTAAVDKFNAGTGWVSQGTWNIIAANNPPVIVSLTPSSLTSSAGSPEVFTAVYRDPDGYSHLKTVGFQANTAGTVANSIRLRFNRLLNTLYMFADDGKTLLPVSCTLGGHGTLENSQGILDCAGTTISSSGAELTVNWKITPKTAFVGNKVIKLSALDALGASGTVPKGHWTINP